jgi:predicted metal-binding protein
MNANTYAAIGESFPPLSSREPDAAFVARWERENERLREIVLSVKAADEKVKDEVLRAGLMDPRNAVIREEIKSFCAIPYRRREGPLAPCEGITYGWKGCPPHSPPVAETISLLRSASAFLILQFSGLKHHSFQKHIHEFTLSLEAVLRGKGWKVLQSYSTGPCRLCAKGCAESGDCRQPQRRRFALESCGFWVKSLCRAAARFPLCGDGEWEIEWIRDWNLPSQSPPTYRAVTGILLVHG